MQQEIPASRYLNRFSILLATLALGFAVIYLLPAEAEVSSLDILGIQFKLSFFNFVPLLLALVAGAGAVWVYSTHPVWQQEKLTPLPLLPHLMLPFIATMILAIVLRQSARSLTWWVVFLVGYIIIALLLRAEYVLIDSSESRVPGYSIMVISFSFGLFLLLTIALKNSDTRIIAQFFALFLSGLFVSYRLLSLREGSEDNLMKAGLAAWLVSLLAVALHYVFIRPIQYGIILTGLLYSLSTWLNQYQPGKRWNQYLEPTIMSVVTILMVVISSLV